MRYDGSLISLNGKRYSNIISYVIQRNKLWSEDTGRNMAGSMKGSLVGRFPKLKIQIGPGYNEDEISELINVLDMASFTLRYYSGKYKTYLTAEYYAGDYDEELLLAIKDKLYFNTISVNLIPIESEAEHVKDT